MSDEYVHRLHHWYFCRVDRVQAVGSVQAVQLSILEYDALRMKYCVASVRDSVISGVTCNYAPVPQYSVHSTVQSNISRCLASTDITSSSNGDWSTSIGSGTSSVSSDSSDSSDSRDRSYSYASCDSSAVVVKICEGNVSICMCMHCYIKCSKLPHYVVAILQNNTMQYKAVQFSTAQFSV